MQTADGKASVAVSAVDTTASHPWVGRRNRWWPRRPTRGRPVEGLVFDGYRAAAGQWEYQCFRWARRQRQGLARAQCSHGQAAVGPTRCCRRDFYRTVARWHVIVHSNPAAVSTASTTSPSGGYSSERPTTRPRTFGKRSAATIARMSRPGPPRPRRPAAGLAVSSPPALVPCPSPPSPITGTFSHVYADVAPRPAATANAVVAACTDRSLRQLAVLADGHERLHHRDQASPPPGLSRPSRTLPVSVPIVRRSSRCAAASCRRRNRRGPSRGTS